MTIWEVHLLQLDVTKYFMYKGVDLLPPDSSPNLSHMSYSYRRKLWFLMQLCPLKLIKNCNSSHVPNVSSPNKSYTKLFCSFDVIKSIWLPMFCELPSHAGSVAWVVWNWISFDQTCCSIQSNFIGIGWVQNLYLLCIINIFSFLCKNLNNAYKCQQIPPLQL